MHQPSVPRTSLSAVILSLIFCVFAALPAGAVPFDNKPKILLHVTAPAVKNQCNLGVLADCGTAETRGGLYSATGPHFVYLLVARGNLPDIAGLQCGITYQGGLASGAGDGIGLDIYSWNLCSTFEFQSGNWPAPGSGNLMTWSVGNCRTAETGVVGYFYVGAYGPDTLRVTPRPVDGAAKVAICPVPDNGGGTGGGGGGGAGGGPTGADSGTRYIRDTTGQRCYSGAAETVLTAADLGSAVFSSGAVAAGCNPCIDDCAAPASLMYSGYVVTPLGQAQISLAGSTLVVGNIGSSGQDGVSVNLEESLNFEMGWNPIDSPGSAPAGAFIRASVAGSVGGVLNQPIGDFQFTKSGSTFQITVDYSAIGSATHEVQVYNDSILVAALTGLSGPVGSVPNVPVAIGTIGDSTDIFTARMAAVETFTIHGTPYSGNLIRILAESPSDTTDYRTRFELRLKDISPSFAAPNSPTFHQFIIWFLQGLTCGQREYYSATYNAYDNPSTSVLAQSFSATTAFRLCSVEVPLLSLTSCPVTVSVQSGPFANSPVLSSVSRQTGFAIFGAKWVLFDLPDIDIAANATYYIRVTGCGSNYPRWRRHTAGSYPRGNAWSNGAAIAGDFQFRTRGKDFTTTTCSSSIVRLLGSAGTQNVGQLVRFGLSPALPGGTTYQWMVDGDVLEDYSEHTQNGLWSTDPMDPPDSQGSTIQFYWKPDPSQVHPLNGGAVARNVRMIATLPGGAKCIRELAVNVERNNTSVSLQPQDIYAAGHNGGGKEGPIVEHSNWHATYSPSTGYGERFLVFHRAYISRFDSWRKEFGYPPVLTWDPGTAIPGDQEILPGGGVTRNATYPLTPVPSWFTVAGGTGSRPTGYTCSNPSGQKKLNDFVTRDQLGCALNNPFHNSVHVNIGGTMGSATSAPRDGIFWRWHKFLDTIHENWLQRPGSFALVADMFPMFIFPYRVAAPSHVALVFSRPLVGIQASSVTVNSSPAVAVTGSGAGPYIFTGYAVPALGPMTIQIAAAGIQDTAGVPFQGDQWDYVLLSPGGDEDSDGLTNAQEVDTYYTSPVNPDTDGDGVSDFQEILNGTNPLDPGDPVSGVGHGMAHITSLKATPNPFLGKVAIHLSLFEPGRVSVRIYDVAGRLERTLLDEEVTNTHETLTWDGFDDESGHLPGGVYFVRAVTKNKTVVTRVVKVQ